jgi:membrane protein DedA with SNARE-associated domain
MFKHANWKLTGILIVETVVIGAAAVYWMAKRAAPPRYVTIGNFALLSSSEYQSPREISRTHEVKSITSHRLMRNSS